LDIKKVARAMLSAAKDNVPDVLKASPPDLGPEWLSWLIAWIHVNEAGKLVEPDLRADNSLPGSSTKAPATRHTLPVASV
jgi:hypothetical protein